MIDNSSNEILGGWIKQDAGRDVPGLKKQRKKW